MVKSKPGRSINPADAHRKAMRKRELKKNKLERKRVREITMAQKDTSKLEGEINRYKALLKDNKLDKNGRAKLQQLQDQLSRIKKIKEEHGISTQKEAEDTTSKNPFEKNPEASPYYHPLFNPTGMPPPGAFPVYPTGYEQQKDEEKDEDEDEDEYEESDDEDMSEDESDGNEDSQSVASGESLPSLPDGEPPQKSQDDLDDLPDLPPEPAPNEVGEELPELPPGPPPLPPGPPPEFIPHIAQFSAPSFQAIPPYPPSRPHFIPYPRPPPSSQFQPPSRPPPPSAYGPRPIPIGQFQRPPPAFHRPPPPGHYGPRPPFPGRPLPVGLPTGPRGAVRPPPSQPPSSSVKTTSSTTIAKPSPTAVISAAPQLRNLQKELTTMVPTALARKKQTAKSTKQTSATPLSLTSTTSATTKMGAGLDKVSRPGIRRPVINAAPDLEDDDPIPENFNLKDLFKGVVIPPAASSSTTQSLSASSSGSTADAGNTEVKKPTRNEEYERFMKEMEGLI
ncbi:uncharacterized protein VTP21DRAFT_4028 [Calcarisporiella thermophila]|uniref:uncharacterized protein n=1 Tax=Calcarisporiella thermophila TaxID=911321 RepID=UPI00374314D6